MRPYVQAHRVRAQDTGGVAAAGLAGIWAAPSRIDDEGRIALDLLARGRRSELHATDAGTPAAVAWAQACLRVVPDGAWGPKRRAVCRAVQRGAGLPETGKLDNTLRALGSGS